MCCQDIAEHGVRLHEKNPVPGCITENCGFSSVSLNTPVLRTAYFQPSAVNATADGKVDKGPLSTAGNAGGKADKKTPSAAVSRQRDSPPPKLTLPPRGLPKNNPSCLDDATFNDAPARRKQRQALQARDVTFAGAVALGALASFFLCAPLHIKRFFWAPLRYLLPCSYSFSVIILYSGWDVFHVGNCNRRQ